MTEYSELEVANDYLDDPEGLNEAFERQGYLFFRGVLDTDEVGAVRADFMAELGRQRFVVPGASRPVWTGRDLEELDDDRLYALDYYPKLLDTDTTRAFTEGLFGGPVFMFRACTIRYTMPHDAKHGSPPHQDHFYIRHTPDFRTLWIPLMDVDRPVGGLAVAQGSHKRGLREHDELDVYSYVLPGRKQKGVVQETISEPWLTTDYHAGDVIVFHSQMLHWALPNTSDVIRLSIDVRCQPASSPRSWQSETNLTEQRRLRTDAQEIAIAEGADKELFEALIIEMMAKGVPAERAPIRELMAELSAGRQPVS
jgi:1-deoxypentalenic acid 11beta-hydroxylase